MNKLELLSPAKNLEIGMAAINCGADAVYIGAPQFGAREAATNSLNHIESLIRYAHQYWARVYVTVNTLLYDEELSAAEKLIHQLYQAGVDAVIIQDAGLLECSLPPIPLFASTQMHNHTAERIHFLEKVGIQRVILARELRLEEIKLIRSQTKIELETFIHGALCVSYSGQCYASYAIGGRSGNRGQCAQPCRQKYSLVDDQGRVLQKSRHLLSLKDLNLGDHLEELCKSGINSFKIEGRLKDKAYVMNIVSYYRRKLDQILKQGPYQPASSGKSRVDFEPDPNKTFNRGYTSYFLNHRDPQMGSLDSPKSMGQPIGKVAAVDNRTFTLQSTIPLHNGDGICFFDTRRELCGTMINQVNGQQMTPQKMDGILPGVLIYRNFDNAFQSMLNKNRPERKITLSMYLTCSSDTLSLVLTDEDSNTASVEAPYHPQTAREPKQVKANIRKHLQKLGETPFVADLVEIYLPQPLFIPVSTLNLLRRSGIEQLIEERLKNHLRPDRAIITNEVPFPSESLGFDANILNQKASDFYRRHGVKMISPAAESGIQMRGKKVMTTRYCIKFQLQMCPRQNPAIPTRENLSLLDEEGNQFPLKFDCSRCQMEVYFNSSAK